MLTRTAGPALGERRHRIWDRRFKFDSTVYRVQDWTSDGDALAAAVRDTCTDRGSTALWDALDGALADLEDRPSTDLRAVIVLSDGQDNASSVAMHAVIDRARADKVPVLAIGLGYADIFALMKLGERTRGGFVYVPSGEKLVDAFETAAAFVRESYVLDFSSEDVPTDLVISATLPDGDMVSGGFDRF